MGNFKKSLKEYSREEIIDKTRTRDYSYLWQVPNVSNGYLILTENTIYYCIKNKITLGTIGSDLGSYVGNEWVSHSPSYTETELIPVFEVTEEEVNYIKCHTEAHSLAQRFGNPLAPYIIRAFLYNKEHGWLTNENPEDIIHIVNRSLKHEAESRGNTSCIEYKRWQEYYKPFKEKEEAKRKQARKEFINKISKPLVNLFNKMTE